MIKDPATVALIEEVRSLYRGGAGLLETTKKELELWERVKWTFVPPSPRARDWFKEFVEIQNDAVIPRGIEIRFSLLTIGAVTLLEAMADGLAPGKAQQLLIQAKAKRRIFQTPIEQGLAEGLEEYRKTGKISDVSQLEANDTVTVADVRSTKAFHAAVKRLALEYIEQRLPAADQGERNEAIEGFIVELRESFDELLRKVARFSRDVLRRERVGIGEVDEACEVLGLYRERGSESVDMGLARKQHRRLSAQLHPDRDVRNANPGVVAQYTAIQEAWELLCVYDKQRAKSEKHRAGYKEKS